MGLRGFSVHFRGIAGAALIALLTGGSACSIRLANLVSSFSASALSTESDLLNFSPVVTSDASSRIHDTDRGPGRLRTQRSL